MASAAEQLASNLNFSTFAKAEDLKKRLWFTLAALLVYRLGTHIPLPGLNPEAYAAAFQVIHNHLDAALAAANVTSVTGTLNAQARSAARSALSG